MSDLRCPECGHIGAVVSNSRPRGNTVFRRRDCKSCGHRWSTIEAIGDAVKGPSVLRVASPDETHQLFARWMFIHRIEDMGRRAVEETA